MAEGMKTTAEKLSLLPRSEEEGVDAFVKTAVPTRGSSRSKLMGLVATATLAAGLMFVQTSEEAQPSGTPTELGSLKSAYCNMTISKNTYAVSDPQSVKTFMYKYFPVRCETDGGFTEYSLCEHSAGSCGSYVRLALNGSNEGESAPCFGMHFVDASSRPDGNTGLSTVETHFDNRLDSMESYDTFLDYSTMFVSESLDDYITTFERDNVAYMLLRWKDNSDIHTSDGGTTGRTFFSLVVHVPGTQINFELISAQAPSGKQQRPIYEDDTVRLPHTAFSSAGAPPPGSGYLTPVAISKATSDINEISTFYTQVLEATLDYEYLDNDAGYTMQTYRLPSAAMPIRFVQRQEMSEYDFKVIDLEQAKNDAHDDAYTSEICGYDKFMDNHFDLTQYQVPIDTYTSRFTAMGNKWHCNKVGFGAIDVYGVEPTGDAIQLDGYLTDSGETGLMNVGCYNTSNVLFELCSQGKCHHKSAPVSHLPDGSDDYTKDSLVADDTADSTDEASTDASSSSDPSSSDGSSSSDLSSSDASSSSDPSSSDAAPVSA